METTGETKPEIKETESIFSSLSYDLDVKIVDKEKLWRKIISSIETILISAHSAAPKRKISTHDDRIKVACVYCGDSHKDQTKKRANIFSDSMQYHCFNGDCDIHRSIYNFLKDYKELENFTPDEQLFMKEAGSTRSLDLKKIKSFLGLESFFTDDIIDLGIDRDYFMKKMRLQEIKGSRIEKYLKERLQFSFHRFGWDPKKGLLYVFNMNREEDRIIGLQVKTFNKRNPYLTYRISLLHQNLGILVDKNKESLEKLDILSTIFGIFQCDLNKPITIFEGPLDSFLFPNSVALCSAKNSMPFDIEGARYFYDNDKTGREWSMKRIAEGRSVFMWKKYLMENELYNVADKIKDLNDLLIFIKRSGRKCKKFSEYFTDSKYDMIHI